MAAVRHAEYVNYCHQCGRAVSSARAGRCDGCGWLRCRCGACGCSYTGEFRLSELAMVPPVWSRLLAQPVAGAPSPTRVPRVVPLITLLAAVAVIGALGLDGYLPVPDLALPAPPEIQLTWPWLPGDSAAPGTNGSPTEPLLGGTGAMAAPQRRPLDPLAPVSPAPSTAASTASAPLTTGAPSTVLYVANTAGQGAYIRSQPREAADTRITAWAEGTAMTTLETRALPDAEGSTVWVRVRDPRGTEGWLRQAYLAPTP